jgi:hypothetical protein
LASLAQYDRRIVRPLLRGAVFKIESCQCIHIRRRSCLRTSWG